MTEREALQAAFKEAYASLNAAQKEAVDTIEGPVMVIAGPGTGKTQILTLRIANILLKTDIQPDNILALTFTESGAATMRKRLRRYVGTAAYRVNICTFHGFTQQLISQYPDAFPAIIGGRPASELERVAAIETILESPTFKLLRPVGNPSYYVNALLGQISTLKRENINPDALREIIVKQEETLSETQRLHEKGVHKGKVRSEYQKLEKVIAKNYELLAVYQQYEALLPEQHLYDFDDMISGAIEALSDDEGMLRDIQETYQYLLADEHQDVNGSQNKILELIASYHDQPNLFVVGDEKQAIFRFQGASLNNFLHFEDLYPHTKVISLTQNYRSGQPVLDAAHSLIGVTDGPLAKLRIPLSAATDRQSAVELRSFTHQAVEDIWLSETIATLIKDGEEPEEIALIVRTNREVERYAGLLRERQLPVTASAEGDVLHHPITKSVVTLINAVANSDSDPALFALLHEPYWNITPADLCKVLAARSYQQSLISIMTDSTKLQELQLENSESILKLIEILQTARDKSLTETPHRVLEYLLQETGFLQRIIEDNTAATKRVLRRLYDEIELMVVTGQAESLTEVQRQLQLLGEHNLPLKAPYIATVTSAVLVMTAHKAKGLEFKHVFIPQLVDSVWGGRVNRQLFSVPLGKYQTDALGQDDDERRLLYVAMTRAKERLYLSEAATNSEGREFTTSRLATEIESKYYAAVATGKLERQFDPLSALSTKSTAPAIPVEFFRHALSERGLSATALNNYLKSPWNYVYRNVLQIPEVQPLHMLYGTVIHKVMESVTRFHTKKQQLPNDTLVKQYLEWELGRLPLSVEEYTRLHEKGLTALSVYLDHVKGHLPVRTEEEFTFRVLLPTGLGELPELPLTGKLDRLDFAKDGQLLQVVDYKTGRPKTRNAIEGKTKSEDGGYKRQLVFYALLLSLYDDERYQVRNMVLSFVEPDSKGKIHEEVFSVSDEEIAELREQIIKIAQEICKGSFLSLPCDPQQSDYCDYALKLAGE